MAQQWHPLHAALRWSSPQDRRRAANPRSHPQRAEVTLRPERGLTPPFQFQNYSSTVKNPAIHGLHEEPEASLCPLPPSVPGDHKRAMFSFKKQTSALRTQTRIQGKVAKGHQPCPGCSAHREHATNSSWGFTPVSQHPGPRPHTRGGAVPPSGLLQRPARVGGGLWAQGSRM